MARHRNTAPSLMHTLHLALKVGEATQPTASLRICSKAGSRLGRATGLRNRDVGELGFLGLRKACQRT